MENTGEVQMSLFSCDYCGKPLPKGRADMRYHPDCRKAMWRYRQRCHKHVAKVVADLEILGELLAIPASGDCALEGLKKASETIEAIYRKNRIQRVR